MKKYKNEPEEYKKELIPKESFLISILARKDKKIFSIEDALKIMYFGKNGNILNKSIHCFFYSVYSLLYLINRGCIGNSYVMVIAKCPSVN